MHVYRLVLSIKDDVMEIWTILMVSCPCCYWQPNTWIIFGCCSCLHQQRNNGINVHIIVNTSNLPTSLYFTNNITFFFTYWNNLCSNQIPMPRCSVDCAKAPMANDRILIWLYSFLKIQIHTHQFAQCLAEIYLHNHLVWYPDNYGWKQSVLTASVISEAEKSVPSFDTKKKFYDV